MRAVVQRVVEASVEVAGEQVASIGTGLLVLLGITHDDDHDTARALAAKIVRLRIMRAETGVADAGGAVLIVSQFTLYGDVGRGRRPSWGGAAPGPVAEPLVETFARAVEQLEVPVQTGVFGADMRVRLVNDGPVTLVIDA